MKISRLDAIRPQRISYLIRPYLPTGSLCFANGDPEAGKTTAVISLAAAVTRGERHPIEPEDDPGDQHRRPRSVLFLSAEDAPQVLQERAVSAGADPERFFVLSGSPVPLDQVNEYRRVIVESELGLLVLDPLQAFLGCISSSSQRQVRGLLSPIIELAKETGCCVLGLRHLTKSAGARSAYRALGSIDFRAAARSVIRLGQDPHNPARRVLVHSKFSLGPKACAQEYEIAPDIHGRPRVHWCGVSELTEAELDARPPRRRGRTALDLAKEFLQDVLAAGPIPAREIRQRASAEGIAARTLEHAKKNLGIASKRIAGEARGAGHWVWGWPRDLGDSPAEDLPSTWPAEPDQDRTQRGDDDLGRGAPDDREDDDPADWWRAGGGD